MVDCKKCDNTHRLNRHTGTMECKWKEDILSLMAFKLCSKDGLGERKGVSNVQHSVGIGIRKGDNEFFTIGGSVSLKGLLAFPHGLYLNFIESQGVTFRVAFGTSRDNWWS